MKPIDYRNETWAQLQGRIVGMRRTVLDAWTEQGPGTTREVAARAGIDLLTFRPRSTELFELGMLVLVDGSREGREGIYRMATLKEAKAAFHARQNAEAGQLQLKI